MRHVVSQSFCVVLLPCASSDLARLTRASDSPCPALRQDAPLLIERKENRSYFAGLFSKDGEGKGGCFLQSVRQALLACLPCCGVGSAQLTRSSHRGQQLLTSDRTRALRQRLTGC